MKYNQESLDELKPQIAKIRNFWKDLYALVNKGKSIENHVAASTLRDALKTFRAFRYSGKKPIDKEGIFKKALTLLNIN